MHGRSCCRVHHCLQLKQRPQHRLAGPDARITLGLGSPVGVTATNATQIKQVLGRQTGGLPACLALVRFVLAFVVVTLAISSHPRDKAGRFSGFIWCLPKSRFIWYPYGYQDRAHTVHSVVSGATCMPPSKHSIQRLCVVCMETGVHVAP